MADVSVKKRIWGWFFFDWASQPYHTLLVTFIFGPYFAVVAAEHFMASGLGEEAAKANAQTLWSRCLAITGLIIGIGAPIMGALADTTGKVRPWVFGFSVMYVLGAAAIWYVNPDGSNLWFGLVVFSIGFIGAEYALIFVNSQLPSLGSHEEVGGISGSGFAFGYFGGVAALAVMLLLFVAEDTGKTVIGLDPLLGFDPSEKEGTRFVGPFVALWFVLFMIPYFLWVKGSGKPNQRGSFGQALKQVGQTISKLRYRPSLASYLGSSMLYRDALNGLYGFGGTYAAFVLDWDIAAIGKFGIIAAIAAAIFSWVGGQADRKYGPKPVIVVSIIVLMLVCFTVVNMNRETIFGIPLAEGSTLPDTLFFICGALIGGFGGVLQASSRSLMVRHSDPERPTESFGLYGLSGRATAFIAPSLVGLATAVSGNVQIGLVPMIGLFLLGLILLRWVQADGESEYYGQRP